MEEEKSFAELFESHSETPSRKLAPGERVSGRVVKITKDTVFVDLGGKSEGFANSEEFIDERGSLTVREGDRIDLKVASVKDGIFLSKGIKVQGDEAIDMLRDAHRDRVPVEGRVTAVRKGGFDVDLSGLRAFCPISQIDLQFCEKPEGHVGKRYPFRILEIKERGRDIVVSRRVVLQEEQERKLKETLASLQPGMEVDGKVTRLMGFGAFVNLGGVEGMVHVSEISHARVRHPSDILQTGQDVRVRVNRVEQDKDGRPKISLSIKALEPDAWEKGLSFQEGDIISGKISRLADFGAFVEVAPGVDGLVHVSEISYERVSHPKKLLHEGDPVEVLVMGIDVPGRRISLSIKEVMIRKKLNEEGGDIAPVRLEVGQILSGLVEDHKPYGLFVRLPRLGTRVRGLLPMEELKVSEKGDVKRRFPKGSEVQVEIVAIDDQGRIRLSQKVMEEREDRNSYEKFLHEGDTHTNLGTLGDLLKDLKLK